MANRLQFGRDTQGYNAFAPYPSSYKWKATLTANNATSIVIPFSFPLWIVSFRYFPNDVWVDVSGATAAVPVGGTLTATTAELNPASLTLEAGKTISVITSQATADISIVMWPSGV